MLYISKCISFRNCIRTVAYARADRAYARADRAYAGAAGAAGAAGTYPNICYITNHIADCREIYSES
jgi:hypothetical protein